MKIVHYVSYFQEILTYEENISVRSISQMFPTFVITSDRYFPFPHYQQSMQGRLGKRIRSVGLFDYETFKLIRLPTLAEFGTDLIVLGLFRAVSSISPKIIHCHNIFGYGPVLLSMIKCIFKKDYKLVFDLHMLPKPKSFVKKLFYRFSELIFLPFLRYSGDLFIGTTPHTTKYLTEYYKFEPSKVKFLPLPVDSIFFDHSTLSTSSATFTMIFSGKIYEKKGLETVIQLFNTLSHKFNNIELIFVGSGPEDYIVQLENLVDESCRDSFRIFPFTTKENLAKYFSRADIGLWIGEIPSISTNEALATGLPIVVKHGNQGSHEALESGGFVFKSGNSSQLLQFIEDLITSPDQLTRLKQQAKSYAWQHFSAKHHISVMLKELGIQINEH